MASNGRSRILAHKLADVLMGPNVTYQHLSCHPDGAKF
eukprot:COSAG02_NODE_67418_length_253_cov_0.655844_1_plen_37_part_01